MTTKLPKAVREAGERADEALKAAQVKPGDAGQPKPADDATIKPDEATPSAADLKAQLDTLQARYSTLQGKYDAEVKPVKDLEAQNAGLQSQLQTLQTQIQTIQAELEAAKARPAVNEKLENARAEYGEEHQMFQLVADQQATIDTLNKTVQELNRKLSGVQTDLTDTKTQTTKSQSDAFYKALDEKIPDWETRNKYPGWLKWLAGIDQFTGKKRQDLLDAAHAALDAQRVINFFNAYGEFKASNKQPTLDANIADLADAGGSGGGGELPKRKWKPSEIREFYEKRSKGQVNDKDFAETQADILAAQTEGRILKE